MSINDSRPKPRLTPQELAAKRLEALRRAGVVPQGARLGNAPPDGGKRPLFVTDRPAGEGMPAEPSHDAPEGLAVMSARGSDAGFADPSAEAPPPADLAAGFAVPPAPAARPGAPVLRLVGTGRDAPVTRSPFKTRPPAVPPAPAATAVPHVAAQAAAADAAAEAATAQAASAKAEAAAALEAVKPASALPVDDVLTSVGTPGLLPVASDAAGAMAAERQAAPADAASAMPVAEGAAGGALRQGQAAEVEGDRVLPQAPVTDVDADLDADGASLPDRAADVESVAGSLQQRLADVEAGTADAIEAVQTQQAGVAASAVDAPAGEPTPADTLAAAVASVAPASEPAAAVLPAAEPVPEALPAVATGTRTDADDEDPLATRPAGPTLPVEAVPALLTIDLDAIRWRGELVPDAAHSRLADEFRVIAQPLVAAVREETPIPVALAHRIIVTSARHGEGRTFVATNLAMTLVAQGLSVLLIDADLLRPAMSLRLGLPAATGLSDALRDPDLLLRCVHATNVTGLRVLPVGNAPASPDTLGSDRFGALLDALDQAFPGTVLLIDAPALMESQQARVVAARGGQVLVVVETTRTRQAVIAAAASQLAALPVVSMVLNRLPPTAEAAQYPRFGHYAESDPAPTRVAAPAAVPQAAAPAAMAAPGDAAPAALRPDGAPMAAAVLHAPPPEVVDPDAMYGPTVAVPDTALLTDHDDDQPAGGASSPIADPAEPANTPRRQPAKPHGLRRRRR